jgi:hypothetical protein
MPPSSRLSALQKAVLFYFIDPDGGGWRIAEGFGYSDGTARVLRWVAELRGEILGLFNLRRGGCTSENLRRSFYRSLRNMENKGLLVRVKREVSGYTRFITLTPKGIQLAYSVEPRDFLAPFEELRRENKQKAQEFAALFEWALRQTLEQG